MAPPKRKGGRTTPKGTRPGEAGSGTLPKAAASAPISSDKQAHHATQASARYTPPVPKYVKESSPWVPRIMFALLALGIIAIMCYYLIKPWRELGQWTLFVGLAFILGGLYTATKWH